MLDFIKGLFGAKKPAEVVTEVVTAPVVKAKKAATPVKKPAAKKAAVAKPAVVKTPAKRGRKPKEVK
jgi:hypothetical protein